MGRDALSRLRDDSDQAVLKEIKESGGIDGVRTDFASRSNNQVSVHPVNLCSGYKLSRS